MRLLCMGLCECWMLVWTPGTCGQVGSGGLPGAAQALLSFQRHEEPGLCLIAAGALEDVLPA